MQFETHHGKRASKANNSTFSSLVKHKRGLASAVALGGVAVLGSALLYRRHLPPCKIVVCKNTDDNEYVSISELFKTANLSSGLCFMSNSHFTNNTLLSMLRNIILCFQSFGSMQRSNGGKDTMFNCRLNSNEGHTFVINHNEKDKNSKFRLFWKNTDEKNDIYVLITNDIFSNKASIFVQDINHVDILFKTLSADVWRGEYIIPTDNKLTDSSLKYDCTFGIQSTLQD